MNLHFSQGIKQYPGFIMMRDVDLLCQIPLCNGTGKRDGFVQRTGDTDHNNPRQYGTDDGTDDGQRDQQEAVGFEITFHLISRLFHMRILNGD